MQVITDGTSAAAQFLFAHGAGAPMDSPFMNQAARAISGQGIEVVRFEFPYMASRREGKRRPPDREAALLATWRELIEARRDGRKLFIGGKSMGGRMATMIADEMKVDGVVCFGYPFHPPGKPEKLRVAHLETLVTPTLILQGTRDALGNHEEVTQYRLSRKIEIAWIEGGDHSLQRGRKDVEGPAAAFAKAAEFMRLDG